MEKEHPKLDVAMMKRLYEFGGLLVYTVKTFDVIRFEPMILLVTFSEKAASRLADHLKSENRPFMVESTMVHFNGAFALKD